MRITVESPITDQDAFVFERMHAHEELGRPYLYSLHVLSSSRNISLSSLLGEIVKVHVEVGPGVERHFAGYVTRAVALGSEGSSARYRLELRPWLSLLQHTATCRIWQKKTVLDVLKEVASFSGFSFEVASTSIFGGREWEYLVQYRESDFNFFMRLLEQEGLWFYVRQDKDKYDLFLTDHLLDHDSASEDRSIPFHPSGAFAKLTEDVFDQWTPREQLRTTHYELDDYNYENARGDLFARSGEPAKVAKTGNKGAEHEDRAALVYDYPGEYVSADDGKTLSTTRQEELRADRQIVHASGTLRDLTAGSVFKLTRHANDTQNAQWAVTSMDLNIEAAAAESGAENSDFVVRSNFTLISTSVPFRLKRTSVKPTIAGPQTAVVVGPKGEEIKVDALGRVRVKFRWDRTGMEKSEHENKGEDEVGAENSSCWIRVVQPWASSGFGFQFIPRIGDEVVVQFLEGDPDRPLITGSLYNSVNVFPFKPGSNPTQSGIKTRSSKEGGEDNANIIRFEDAKKSEEFFVQAERNHTVKVKADRSVSVGGNESYSVTGTRDTTITKKNTDTYKDEHKMEVTGKVEEIFHNEHVLKVTNKQTIDVTNDVVEHITQNYELTTDQKFLLTQGGTTMKFEGNAVTVDAAKEITIVHGESSIKIDLQGAITLSSPLKISLMCNGMGLEVSPAGVTVIGAVLNMN